MLGPVKVTATPSLMVAMLVVLSLFVTGTAGKMQLINNGYEAVVVSICTNDVQGKEHELVQRLEEVLTQASAVLFRATRYQIYFRDFIILVPESWVRNDSSAALDDDVGNPQFIIEAPDPLNGDTPYVKQFDSSCGKPGDNIHLTPNYIMNPPTTKGSASPGKTIVHEWAHYRWGVFDEYAVDKDDSQFYLKKAGVWAPTKCSDDVMVETTDICKISANGVVENDSCQLKIVDNPLGTQPISSLMFAPNLDSVVEFCDDATHVDTRLWHNAKANHRQNRICDSASVWEVMRRHSDFANQSLPLPIATNTKPMFKYVQAGSRRIVLVLDVSGSMAGTPLAIMRLASTSYMLNIVKNQSQVGIVRFSNVASILSPLITISSQEDRQKLAEALPSSANGGTSIGGGLQKGIEVLGTSGESKGGSIILITDGKENKSPYIRNVLPILLEKKIVVHSLSIGQQADVQISKLSSATGGKTYFHDGEDNSTALFDGLADTVVATCTTSQSDPIFVLTDAAKITNTVPYIINFIIDSTISMGLTMTLTYSQKVTLSVKSPDREYTPEKDKDVFTDNKLLGVVTMSVPSTASIGLWSYFVTTDASFSIINFNVQSMPNPDGKGSFQIRSWMTEEKEIVFSPKKDVCSVHRSPSWKSSCVGSECDSQG